MIEIKTFGMISNLSTEELNIVRHNVDNKIKTNLPKEDWTSDIIITHIPSLSKDLKGKRKPHIQLEICSMRYYEKLITA